MTAKNPRTPSTELRVFRQGKPLPESGTQYALKTHSLPAVVLHMAKYPHNVGQAVRILSCYGVNSLWLTGDRFDLQPHEGYRLPREERMRGYSDVTLFADQDPLTKILERHPGVTPVAVELVPGAEELPKFQHPENAVYVFGPEDGGLPGSILKRCHRFVRIPTAHCLNLATAVGTVLYDREAKNHG